MLLGVKKGPTVLVRIGQGEHTYRSTPVLVFSSLHLYWMLKEQG